MLFNEPKLLKLTIAYHTDARLSSFSALQRAEIAEIPCCIVAAAAAAPRFSALQRAEIAEILTLTAAGRSPRRVSVLFNEPKLLKCRSPSRNHLRPAGFSALQRAEIAEMRPYQPGAQVRL